MKKISLYGLAIVLFASLLSCSKEEVVESKSYYCSSVDSVTASTVDSIAIGLNLLPRNHRSQQFTGSGISTSVNLFSMYNTQAGKITRQLNGSNQLVVTRTDSTNSTHWTKTCNLINGRVSSEVLEYNHNGISYKDTTEYTYDAAGYLTSYSCRGFGNRYSTAPAKYKRVKNFVWSAGNLSSTSYNGPETYRTIVVGGVPRLIDTDITFAYYDYLPFKEIQFDTTMGLYGKVSKNMLQRHRADLAEGLFTKEVTYRFNFAGKLQSSTEVVYRNPSRPRYRIVKNIYTPCN